MLSCHPSLHQIIINETSTIIDLDKLIIVSNPQFIRKGLNDFSAEFNCHFQLSQSVINFKTKFQTTYTNKPGDFTNADYLRGEKNGIPTNDYFFVLPHKPSNPIVTLEEIQDNIQFTQSGKPLYDAYKNLIEAWSAYKKIIFSIHKYRITMSAKEL